MRRQTSPRRRLGRFRDAAGSSAAQLRHALHARDDVGCGVRGRALKGLRGQKAVNAVFGVVYTGDVLLNTALGLYHPTRWSREGARNRPGRQVRPGSGHRRGVRPHSRSGEVTMSRPKSMPRGVAHSRLRPGDFPSRGVVMTERTGNDPRQPPELLSELSGEARRHGNFLPLQQRRRA